jgi:3'-5' exoribonuclease
VKKQIFVQDITKEHVEINDYFVVTKKGVFTTKSNSKYMSVTLKDRTGIIEGKVWDRVEELQDLFEKNDLVLVRSKSRLYQNKPQLNVSDIRRVETPLALEDMTSFLPESERGNACVREEYAGLVEGLRTPPLRSLFALLREREGLLERFFAYPASIGVHHVYLGGLLEHSVAVAKMAKQSVPFTGGDADIVVAGSLLHDIGKIDEMELRGGFRYSDKGRLLGHITLGIIVFEELIRSIQTFPPEAADILKHIIISHHGVEEWGSPRKPMCIEALIVHYIDNLDAKVMGVKEHMKENMEDEVWSTYHRLYESRFYRIPEGFHGD